MEKLGLIAGGGALPLEIAAACERAGRPMFVVRIQSLAAETLHRFDGVDISLGQFGKAVAALKRAGVRHVCLAGNVRRPDFRTLKTDFRGMFVLVGAIQAAKEGDDALLRHLVREFEKAGFTVEGANEVTGDLLLGVGALGSVQPTREQLRDAAKAMDVAAEIGRLDIGQGAVVCEGLVLAVEAQEGTDLMLKRVAELPPAIRGSAQARRGALAKVPKPQQERRVDLPVIGVATIEGAAAAGLAGVAGPCDGLMVLEREAVVEAADRLGLYVWGASVRGPAAE